MQNTQSESRSDLFDGCFVFFYDGDLGGWNGGTRRGLADGVARIPGVKSVTLGGDKNYDTQEPSDLIGASLNPRWNLSIAGELFLD